MVERIKILAKILQGRDKDHKLMAYLQNLCFPTRLRIGSASQMNERLLW